MAISTQAGTINVNARIHASGNEGVRIEGGNVSGVISISDPAQSASGIYNAITIPAGSADVRLNILATVTSSSPSYLFPYYSAQANGFKVRGEVKLVASPGLTGPYSRGGIESLAYSGDLGLSVLGKVGIGMDPLVGNSALVVNGDISIVGSQATAAYNLYFDGSWKYCGNGFGYLTRLDATGNLLFYSAPSNTAGVGAVAAITFAAAYGANGAVGINELSPDYKLDVNGTFGFTPGASVTPVDLGDVVFQLTSNTTFSVKAKGSDGVIRTGNITLA